MTAPTMKSAEEWSAIGGGPNVQAAVVMIRAIQRDALKAAAGKCREQASQDREYAYSNRAHCDSDTYKCAAEAADACATIIESLMPHDETGTP